MEEVTIIILMIWEPLLRKNWWHCQWEMGRGIISNNSIRCLKTTSLPTNYLALLQSLPLFIVTTSKVGTWSWNNRTMARRETISNRTNSTRTRREHSRLWEWAKPHRAYLLSHRTSLRSNWSQIELTPPTSSDKLSELRILFYSQDKRIWWWVTTRTTTNLPRLHTRIALLATIITTQNQTEVFWNSKTS